MGVKIPQVVTTDRASGAQVIDGSLTLQRANANYLTRAIGTEGNRRTWTYSCWIKRDAFPAASRQLWGQVATAGASATGAWQLYYAANEALEIHTYSLTHLKTNAVYRDTGWYHVVQTLDTTSDTADNRVRLYINGVEQTSFATRNNPNQNLELGVNTVGNMVIGTADNAKSTYYIDAKMAQCYFIDGLALGPGYFGFTDPLTNTWRPKKFRAEGTTVNDGTQWSSLVDVSNATVNNGSAANLFDGNITTKINITGGYIEIDLSSRNVHAGPEGIEVYNNEGGAYTSYQVNGGTAINWQASAGWMSMGGANSKISTIRINHLSGGGVNAAFAFRVNGVTMIDSTTTNLAFGTNGFYLPFDGSAPIGEDKSGQGNDWTPVNFGGSVALDNPQVSGARPILNTTQGGTQAGVGVFGSKENKYYTVTTANGSVYQFDITSGDNPSLSFIRGATYKFDYSSFTGHPVLFSSTNPDSSTTAYTDGTSTASNVISFTVPHNAPDTLYYYCQNHPTAMNGSISITTDETKADPYAWKNVLGLPLVGVKDDLSNQINSGSTTKVVTANGNVAASSALSNFYSGSFYFDGTDDTLTIPDNSDFSFGSEDYTIEMWVYPTRISGTQENLITRGTSGYSGFIMSVTNFLDSTSGSAWDANITYDNPLVANKWQHIAVCRYGDTWTVYINGVANGSDTASGSVSASGTLTIGERTGQTDFQGYMNDVRLYKGVAKYTSNFIPASTNPDILPDTPSGVSGGSKLAIAPDTSTEGAVAFDGNSDYLAVTGPGTLAASSNWCIECTFYCTGNSSGTYRIMSANESAQGSEYFHMRIRNGQYQFYTSNANSLTGTASFFKWTHIAMTKSGTTVRAYVDGVQLWSTTDNNTDSITNLITGWGYGSEYFPGFISNARFVNGSSVYTSEFNPPVVPLTNITNTAYLFCQSNTSATAYAVSPGSITANGTAAASKFTPFNTDINTVRGQETGYATLNPLNLHNTADTLSDGNLKLTSSGSGSAHISVSTLSMSSGKYFCEVKWLDVGQNFCGLRGSNDINYNNSYIYLSNAKASDTNGSSEDASYGSTWTTGDTIGIAYDADNKTLEFFKNGVSQGVAFTSITGTYDPNPTAYQFFFGNWSSQNATYVVNFGQKPFKFSPPDGFQPLNAANVRPVKVISRPDQYVRVTTYTGNAAARSIDVGLKPDFVWIKQRNTTRNNLTFDSVRGATKFAATNSSGTPGTLTQGLTSFDDNGFSIGTSNDVNQDNGTFVVWTWRAGGNKNTFNVDDVGYASAAAAGLTGGDITPVAASVGTKQGFSIIQYQGNGSTDQTIPHGLTQAPDFSIIKNVDGSSNWTVFHRSVTTTTQKVFYLNTTGAIADYSGGDSTWWGTLPGASLFTIGATSTAINNGTNDMISYHWHNVPGLQKFGIYEGNNNSDGPFVELGFRPSIIWMKNIDASGNWIIYDNERDKFNGATKILLADTNGGGNANDAFVGSYPTDFLSNGFKIRNTTGEINNSNTYIYCAWAEAPTVDLFGGGANAR
jgi:hypothetical protein